MKVVKDRLRVSLETWSDPGVYPSGAGGGPLPSYRYVDAVEGSVVLDLDIAELHDAGVLDDAASDLPHETIVKKWSLDKAEVVSGKLRLTLSVDEFEAGDVEEPGPDPDDERDRRLESRHEI